LYYRNYTMNVKYVSIFVLGGLLAVMSGMPPLFSSDTTNYAFARYAITSTQNQANTNECNAGTNCAITSPQTQGDGTANSPTNLQISKFNEQDEQDGGAGEPLPDDPIGILRLITEFICPQGFESVCPPPAGTLKVIHTDGVALPEITGLDRTDITIFLRTTTPPPFPTSYFVEQVSQLPPPGLVVSTTRTPDCGLADITQDEIKTCIITNTYSVAPPPPPP
jgi:hypothetical protein